MERDIDDEIHPSVMGHELPEVSKIHSTISAPAPASQFNNDPAIIPRHSKVQLTIIMSMLFARHLHPSLEFANSDSQFSIFLAALDTVYPPPLSPLRTSFLHPNYQMIQVQ